MLNGDGEVEITAVVGHRRGGARPPDFRFESEVRRKGENHESQRRYRVAGFSGDSCGHAAQRKPLPDVRAGRGAVLSGPAAATGIDSSARVAPTARIGEGASIGPFVVIEDDVEIGKNCVIYPFVNISRGARIGDNFKAYSHVSVREFCRIGNNVTLQDGAKIGADGFGYAKKADGSYYKIVQSGIVVLEDDVEVGANATIDRGTIGETRIRRGAKIDNLVQVGHASDVGENTLLCAQVGLGGSSKIGKNVILTGQVGVAGHLEIGDGVVATAQTGIPNSVEAGTVISGYPAIDNKVWLKSSAVFKRLPELLKRIEALEKGK